MPMSPNTMPRAPNASACRDFLVVSLGVAVALGMVHQVLLCKRLMVADIIVAVFWQYDTNKSC